MISDEDFAAACELAYGELLETRSVRYGEFGFERYKNRVSVSAGMSDLCGRRYCSVYALHE